MTTQQPTSSAPERSHIPVELINRILHFIPSTQKRTLAALLPVSKLFCELVAPRVYEHVAVTPDVDMMVDTGLVADLIPFPSSSKTTDMSDTESFAVTSRFGPDAPTFKARLLGLMRTLEIYPCATHPDDPRRPAPLDSPAPTWPTQSVHLDTLIIHLDTSAAERASPLRPLEPFLPDLDHQERPKTATDGVQPLQLLLARVTARRLVLHGAGFYQTRYPLMRLPRSLLNSVQALYVTVTHGPVPEASLNANHGLPYVVQTLLVAPIPISTPIAFILHPSAPHGRISVGSSPSGGYIRPHANMAMTMDYHPDYAPGWLHALTTVLAREIARAVEDNPKAAVREISFVNFGALDGEEVGMPQAAKEEMQDRFRRGLRIRLERIGAGIGQGDAKEWARVMSMEDWLADSGNDGKDIMSLL